MFARATNVPRIIRATESPGDLARHFVPSLFSRALVISFTLFSFSPPFNPEHSTLPPLCFRREFSRRIIAGNICEISAPLDRLAHIRFCPEVALWMLHARSRASCARRVILRSRYTGEHVSSWITVANALYSRLIVCTLRESLFYIRRCVCAHTPLSAINLVCPPFIVRLSNRE